MAPLLRKGYLQLLDTYNIMWYKKCTWIYESCSHHINLNPIIIVKEIWQNKMSSKIFYFARRGFKSQSSTISIFTVEPTTTTPHYTHFYWLNHVFIYHRAPPSLIMHFLCFCFSIAKTLYVYSIKQSYTSWYQNIAKN